MKIELDRPQVALILDVLKGEQLHINRERKLLKDSHLVNLDIDTVSEYLDPLVELFMELNNEA